MAAILEQRGLVNVRVVSNNTNELKTGAQGRFGLEAPRLGSQLSISNSLVVRMPRLGMLNRSVRREAVEKLRSALRDHENLRKQVERASVRLFEQR